MYQFRLEYSRMSSLLRSGEDRTGQDRPALEIGTLIWCRYHSHSQTINYGRFSRLYAQLPAESEPLCRISSVIPCPVYRLNEPEERPARANRYPTSRFRSVSALMTSEFSSSQFPAAFVPCSCPVVIRLFFSVAINHNLSVYMLNCNETKLYFYCTPYC